MRENRPCSSKSGRERVAVVVRDDFVTIQLNFAKLFSIVEISLFAGLVASR